MTGFQPGLRSTTRLLAIVAVVVAVAVFAVGCGSSDSSSKSTTATTTPTTTGSASAWANGVCSAFAAWKGSLKTALASLESNPSKDALTSAADDAKSATDTLASDLEGLGKPNTEAGQQAQTALERLSKTLAKDVDTIKTAVEGASGATGIINAVSVAKDTLTAMGKDITSTFDQLKSLDAKGELEKAFAQADACASLTK